MKLSNAKIVLPSLFTCLNLAFGAAAIFLCVNARLSGAMEPRFFVLAGWLIIAAIILDGLDGKIARLTNTSSEFGLQLDSLADLVAFGVAPAVLAYAQYLIDLPLPYALFALAFILSGAIRLARFNVTTDGKAKTYFTGLPIPLSGGLIAAFTLFIDFAQRADLPVGNGAQITAVLIFLMAGITFLMVSTIRFDVFYRFVFRNFGFGTRVVIMAGLVIVALRYPGPVFFGVGLFYVAEGLVRWAWRGIVVRKAEPEPEKEFFD